MLWLNAIVAIASAGMLSYTLIAGAHLTEKAREFVTEKTLEYSGPLVDGAQAALNGPLARKLLTKEIRQTLQAEIDRYRTAPAAYVADLTREAQPIAAANAPPPLIEKLVDWKERVRGYYDGTLAALITDFRIFAATNLAAGVLAWGLAYRARRRVDGPVVWFTYTLFIAVIVSAVGYIDDLTFFRILFRTHPGWKYPATVGLLLAYLYFRTARDAEQSAAATQAR